MDRLFEAWRQGEPPPNLGLRLVDTPRRRRTARVRDVLEGEVVERGQVQADNERSEERHVWWVRLPSNELVACACAPDGRRRELTMLECRAIWGHLPHDALSANSRRALETGTPVPLVPPRFRDAKRSRAQAAAASRKRARTEGAGALVWFDCQSAPRLGELRTERPALVPTSLLGPQPPDDEPEADGVEVYRDRVWDVLHEARVQIARNPRYARLLRGNPFASIRSVDDLPSLRTSGEGLQVPLAKDLLLWFHYFFPLDSPRSPPDELRSQRPLGSPATNQSGGDDATAG